MRSVVFWAVQVKMGPCVLRPCSVTEERADFVKVEYPDDGGSKFLRHAVTLLPNHTTSRPIRQFLNSSEIAQNFFISQ